MQCPYCGGNELKVMDTTDTKSGIRRRRECESCGERFTTYERPQSTLPVLIKSNGNREEFDREKLKRGIWNACAKRPIPAAEVDHLVNRIETHLQSLGRAEVSSRVVGDMVIDGLKNLDPIAYIRYAIVYLGLDNLLSVRSEIDKLLADEQNLERSASLHTLRQLSAPHAEDQQLNERDAEPAAQEATNSPDEDLLPRKSAKRHRARMADNTKATSAPRHEL